METSNACKYAWIIAVTFGLYFYLFLNEIFVGDTNKIHHLNRHNVSYEDISGIVKLSNRMRDNSHRNLSIYSDGNYEVRGVHRYWDQFNVGTAYKVSSSSAYNTSGNTFTTSILKGYVTGAAHNISGKSMVKVMNPYDKSMAIKAGKIDEHSCLWLGAGAVAAFTVGSWTFPPMLLFGAMHGAYDGYQGCIMAEKAHMDSIQFGLDCGLQFMAENGDFLNVLEQLFREHGMETTLKAIMDEDAYNVQHHVEVINNMKKTNNDPTVSDMRIDW